MSLQPKKQAGLVRKYSHENGKKKFIGWGPPVKKQSPGFSRKLGQTKIQLLDVVRELRKSGSELLIFNRDDERPRPPSNFELLKPVRMRDKLLVKCPAGHVSERFAEYVFLGRQCYLCSRKRGSKYSIDDLRVFCYKKGGEFLSTKWKTTADQYRFRCREGHEWVTEAKSVLNRGTWCPKCAVRLRGEARRKSRPRK